MTRKVSQEQWAFEVRRALKQRAEQEDRLKRQKYAYYKRFLKRYMPIPYLIGGAAVVTIIVLYGWKEFFKFFLSWTVSVTIIATIAFHVWKHYERKI